MKENKYHNGDCTVAILEIEGSGELKNKAGLQAAGNLVKTPFLQTLLL